MKSAHGNGRVYGQNVIACVWDFDKTLIPGYMQTPLFEAYGIDENLFWREVNDLPDIYSRRGLSVSADTIYLNHLLSYVKNGPLRGLTNDRLVDLGSELQFCPGLPNFFGALSKVPQSEEFAGHDFRLEHYVISTGLTHMIRGSKIAPHVEDIFACEFIESPLPPNYSLQTELSLPLEPEISQIGMVVDNTIKTRYIFEINKGSNKNPAIEVNSFMSHEDRRVPFDQMIYVADGPSDVPVFAVVKQWGGRTYAVYDPANEKEFEQTCRLVEMGRVHNNGPADYRPESSTGLWLRQKVADICREMVLKRENALKSRSSDPPKHLPRQENDEGSNGIPHQETLFE